MGKKFIGESHDIKVFNFIVAHKWWFTFIMSPFTLLMIARLIFVNMSANEQYLYQTTIKDTFRIVRS